jgi:chromosome segregation ATPase
MAQNVPALPAILDDMRRLLDGLNSETVSQSQKINSLEREVASLQNSLRARDAELKDVHSALDVAKSAAQRAENSLRVSRDLHAKALQEERLHSADREKKAEARLRAELGEKIERFGAQLAGVHGKKRPGDPEGGPTGLYRI